MNAAIPVSVVIPARNAAATLPGVLAALGDQTAPSESFEVIVVDDGSTDETAAVAEGSGVARLVRAGGHRTQASARNLGVAEARGEVIAFLDADCVPDRTWIEEGRTRMGRDDADLLAGRIDMALDSRPSAAALVAVTHGFDQERYVADGFAAGGNLWVGRALFEELGGFPPLPSDEDREFTRRATRSGAALRYAPSVRVVHPARSLAEQVRRSYRSAKVRATADPGHLARRAGAGAYADRGYVRRRLTDLGLDPTRGRLLRLALLKRICVTAPMLLGSAAGAAGRLRRHGDEQ
jgi:glycosyltransferase involved in cell wall biosynthesis